MMTEKISVPICKDCYDKKHFTGEIWTNARQEDDLPCSYCEQITSIKTEGYKLSLPCL